MEQSLKLSNITILGHINNGVQSITTYMVQSWTRGGHWPKSRNHMRTTIGCFLFIGKKKL
jgi:hypothetical protein